MSAETAEVQGAATTALMEVGPEQERAIVTQSNQLLAEAQALVVDNDAAEVVAWDILNYIGSLEKRIGADFGPAKKATHAAWQAVIAQEKGHLSRLTQPEQLVRAKLGVWGAEKERVRREEEAAARARAEEEAQVERQRLMEEAKRQEEERRLADAQALETAGNHEAAEMVLEAPVEVEIPEVVVAPVTRTVTKVEGAGSMVETWKFEVENASEVPREFLLIDEQKIRRVVQAMKGDARIPGVKVYSVLEPRRAARMGGR